MYGQGYGLHGSLIETFVDFHSTQVLQVNNNISMSLEVLAKQLIMITCENCPSPDFDVHRSCIHIHTVFCFFCFIS